MRRTFVALRPSDDVLDYVETVVGRARRSMVGPRWLPREQWHVTVHFFGNLDDDAFTRALHTLTFFERCEAFTFAIDSAGAFASERRARVLWLAAQEARAYQAMLADYCVFLAAQGFAVEEPRQMHLTVARLRVPSPAHEAVRAMRDAMDDIGPAPAWRVTEAVLYESQLRREGAHYSVVERARLAAGEGA